MARSGYNIATLFRELHSEHFPLVSGALRFSEPLALEIPSCVGSLAAIAFSLHCFSASAVSAVSTRECCEAGFPILRGQKQEIEP
jgi:hypothetical protein